APGVALTRRSRDQLTPSNPVMLRSPRAGPPVREFSWRYPALAGGYIRAPAAARSGSSPRPSSARAIHLPHPASGNRPGRHQVGVHASSLPRGVARQPMRHAPAIGAAMEIHVLAVPGIGVGARIRRNRDLAGAEVSPAYPVASA